MSKDTLQEYADKLKSQLDEQTAQLDEDARVIKLRKDDRWWRTRGTRGAMTGFALVVAAIGPCPMPTRR